MGRARKCEKNILKGPAGGGRHYKGLRKRVTVKRTEAILDDRSESCWGRSGTWGRGGYFSLPNEFSTGRKEAGQKSKKFPQNVRHQKYRKNRLLAKESQRYGRKD